MFKRFLSARVQHALPKWESMAVLPNKQFKKLSSQDYQGKWLVLFTYPAAFTFACPTEIIEFSERYQQFKDLGCEVVGLSTDTHFVHLAWINTPRKQGGLGDLNIPLVADIKKDISTSFGLLSDSGLAYRATLIVDPKGVVRQLSVNDNAVARNVDEILRLVEAFQYSDKHGEVCPVGWKKGGKTILPDPVKKMDYFSKQ